MYIYVLCYVILCYSILYYIILNMPTRTCAKPRSLGQQDVEGVTGDSTERRGFTGAPRREGHLECQRLLEKAGL
jgi:hypothetical protein